MYPGCCPGVRIVWRVSAKKELAAGGTYGGCLLENAMNIRHFLMFFLDYLLLLLSNAAPALGASGSDAVRTPALTSPAHGEPARKASMAEKLPFASRIS